MSLIKSKIEKITIIDKQIKLLIQKGNFIKNQNIAKDFFNLVDDFIRIRNEIRKEFTHFDSIEIEDQEVIDILRKISSEKDFIADLVINVLDKDSTNNLHELSDAEIDELSSEVLFSWIGPREYVEGIIEVGVLVTNTTLPKIFQSYLEQARKCYAFQQYDAVNALARIILEIALRDICVQCGYIIELQDHKEFYNKYPPKNLINFVAEGKLKDEIKELYYERLSPKIHGLEYLLDKNVQIELKNTLRLVEKLYDKHRVNFRTV